MRKTLTAVLLMLLLGAWIWACGVDKLSSIACDQPCYTGSPKTRHVGACHDGMPVCDDRHHVTQCLGEILPGPEVCNGVDDDCDGHVDVEARAALGAPDGLELTNVDDDRLQVLCGNPGIGNCLSGVTHCIGGAVVCTGETYPTTEDCSGLDKDCDGIANNIKSTVCYWVDPLDANSGDRNPRELVYPLTQCRIGLTGCEGGHEVCLGEVTPQVETCTDTTDKNCDGVVGDGSGFGPTDIVFVLNHDGDVVNASVVAGLTAFATTHASNSFRYSVVDVPGKDTVPAPALVLNAGTATALIAHLVPAELAMSYGSIEMPLLAFHDAATNDLGIAYQQGGRRYIIWFGDDNDCGPWDPSGCSPNLPYYTPDDVLVVMRAAGATFLSFADGTSPDYAPIAAGTGGFAVALTGADSTTINTLLVSAIAPNCH